MKLNTYIKNICKKVKYPGIWIIFELQTNLPFIIGDVLSRFIKPIQFRINKFNKNVLVCWIKPMMIFEIKSQETKLKQYFNLYIGKPVVHQLLFIVKDYK